MVQRELDVSREGAAYATGPKMTEFHVVRVFVGPGDTGGNELGVFLDGMSIAPERRLAVTAELGFSETVFVDDLDTARIAIFVPTTELPFAGHPTVGTSWLLAEIGRPVPVLRPPAGEVPTWRDGDLTGSGAAAGSFSGCSRGLSNIQVCEMSRRCPVRRANRGCTRGRRTNRSWSTPFALVPHVGGNTRGRGKWCRRDPDRGSPATGGNDPTRRRFGDPHPARAGGNRERGRSVCTRRHP